ncbi:MAG: DUF72 domain-containing protein [Candidatus Aureabacteria bacterium]|nr:DUF72 domain-containing protein [Candidatus Auribacterota bacterium]
MNTHEVYIGTAGWSYDDWSGVVYPAGRPRGFDPLEYLSRFLDCVEINSSFYRIPERRDCAAWLRRVERNDRFRFTAKLFRGFTHEIGSCGDAEAAHFMEAMSPLRGAARLGAVLVQFPWSFRDTPEHRGYLGALFDMFKPMPLVLEVRHSSWLFPGLFASLRERGIGFCNIDQPLFHDSIPPSARSTSSTGYFCLHGRNADNWFREGAGRDARYDYLYSDEELEGWVDRIHTVSGALPATYVVMNNHFKGQAVCNALQVKARVSGGRVPVPGTLLGAFPRLNLIARRESVQGELF